MIRVLKDKNSSQKVSIDHKVKDVIAFYSLSIRLFEEMSNLSDERLSKREVDFLVCSLINIHQNNRSLLSENAFEVYNKIGSFKNIQEVRIYSNKDRIKKWLKKDGKSYKLPPFVENLKDSKNTNISVSIILEDDRGED